MHSPLSSLLLLLLPLTHANPLHHRRGGPLVAAPLPTSKLQLNADDQDCFATCISITFCLQEEPELCYCTNDARVQCAIGCGLDRIDLNDCDTGEEGRVLMLSEYGEGTSWAEESQLRHYGAREIRQDPDTGGMIVGGLPDVPEEEETTSMTTTGTATGTRGLEETKATPSWTPTWTPTIESEEIETAPTKTTIVKSAEATATKVVTVIANTCGCPSLLYCGCNVQPHLPAPEEWFAQNVCLPGCSDPVLRTFEHYLGLDNEQLHQLETPAFFKVHTDEHIVTSESVSINPPLSEKRDPRNDDTVDTITPITPIIPVQPIDSIEPIDPISLTKRDNTITPITPIVPVSPITPVKPLSKRTNPANPITPIKPIMPVVPVAPITPLQKRRIAKDRDGDNDILSSERFTRTRKGTFDVPQSKGKGVGSRREGKGKKEEDDVLERVTRVRKVRKGGEEEEEEEEAVGEVNDAAEVVEGAQGTEGAEGAEMGEEVEMVIGEGDWWWRPWWQGDAINIGR
ncbi:hypothetical protein EX30DRAFT_373664 [Ascodesmis nigricans]|uniref:Extracellular membrane protein CFEM domain-containing protein n=1 Tax=Ascodesmis nigricans TaxID=341454 RepID=A0A4S2MND5_9PEZI|nr:hypothetical protein EX30DRAFT_373664 [Ascodesmis nigricans]